MKTCLKCKAKVPNRNWEAHQRFHISNPVYYYKPTGDRCYLSKSVQRRLSAQVGDKIVLKPRSIGYSSDIAKEFAKDRNKKQGVM